jgi:hypothetical protein
MNAPDDRTPHAVRIYEALLWLYPRLHRREYGPLMVQLFRDQCREAGQRGDRRALLKLWLATLTDLAGSVFREQLTQLIQHMKSMPLNKLSLILFALGVGGGLVSCNFILTQPGLALGVAYFAALALWVRAIVEWKRPANELLASLVWGAAIAVTYALIFPVWGRFKLPIIPALIAPAVLLNGLVPLIKAALRIARPRA